MDKKFFKSLLASDFLKSKKFFTNYFFYSFSRNSFRKIIITAEKDLFCATLKIFGILRYSKIACSFAAACEKKYAIILENFCVDV